MIQPANTTVTAKDGNKFRAFWNGSCDERLGPTLASIQLEGCGTQTLVHMARMRVDGQLEEGKPVCKLAGCKFPIEMGTCIKTGK